MKYTLPLTLLVATLIIGIIPASHGDAELPFTDNVYIPEDVQQTRLLRVSSNSPLVSNPAPRFLETSEFMIGSAVAGLFLVEGDGTVSAKLEEWNSKEVEDAVQQVKNALTWWEKQAELNGVQLQFKFKFQGVFRSRYEPLMSGQRNARLWVVDVMQKLGYGSGDHSAIVRSYVNDLRREYSTNWAFAIFMIEDSTLRRLDGASGFAYLGGPYEVVLYQKPDPQSDRPSRIVAHETGHIFYTTDEYSFRGAETVSGYLAAKGNYRSACIMDTASWCLSQGSKLQVGWRDTDKDGLPDILDTVPDVAYTEKPGVFTDNVRLSFKGYAVDKPYSNRNPFGTHRDLSINKVTSFEYSYRFEGSDHPVANVLSDDGDYDSPFEPFQFTITSTRLGGYHVEITLSNSVGNSKLVRESTTVTYVIVKQVVASERRVDVGSQQKVSFYAQWAHNGEPVSSGLAVMGNLTAPFLNGWAHINITSSFEGERQYGIDGVSIFDVKKVVSEVRSVKLVWDRVDVKLSPVKSRLDVNGTAEFTYDASYAYDGAKFEGKIHLNSPLTSAQIGRQLYRVIRIEDSKHGLSAFTSNEVPVVFDRVNITLSLSGTRFNVGESVRIDWKASYQYDGAQFNGRVLFNNTLVKQNVGKYTFTVAKVEDSNYGLTVFNSNQVQAIFDKVSVKLAVERDRVDVGSKVPVLVESKYLYDGSQFEGTVQLNEELVKNNVGRFSYSVSNIQGSKYGLFAFESNTIHVVFDRVDVEVFSDVKRVEVGKSAPVKWRATYAYDRQAFDGVVTLNSGLQRNTVGTQSYQAQGISDSRFNLTVFTSNRLDITFDTVDVKYSLGNRFTIGGIDVLIHPSYTSDGAPVKEADVRINGVRAERLEDGTYRRWISTWLPQFSTSATINTPYFNPVSVTVSEYVWFNLAAWIGVAASSATVAVTVYRKAKAPRRTN